MYICDVLQPKLFNALEIVALHMHDLFNRDGRFIHDISKQSCVLCSLTVRDFLFLNGFRDVEVRPVFVAIRAIENNAELYSLGIGNLNLKAAPDPKRWHGHMVVYLPSDGIIIDTTLYQAKRSYWSKLPSMMVTQFDDSHEQWNLRSIASVMAEQEQKSLIIQWFDQPMNKNWKDGPDTSKRRREPIVKAMANLFKN
jgi:hypothetical protein